MDSKAVKTDNNKTHLNSMNTAYCQKLLQMKDRKIKKMKLASKFTPNLMALKDITKLICNKRMKKC